GHLVDREPQQVAVDRGHALEAPVRGVRGEQRVDALAVARHAGHQLLRVRARALRQLEVAADGVERGLDAVQCRTRAALAGEVGGVEHLERRLARGAAARAHVRRRPRVPRDPPRGAGRPGRRLRSPLSGGRRSALARCAISIAASAASTPLLPCSPPARASAWSTSSQVSTPNATGTSVSRTISRTPSVTALHTYSKCGVPPRITTPRVTSAS